MTAAGTFELTYDGALGFNFYPGTAMRPKVRLLSLAMAVAVTLVIATAVRPVREAYRQLRTRSAMARLSALAADAPVPQSRWSVTAPRPRATEMRSPSSTTSLQLESAAGNVLELASGRDSPDARHATATAQYLAGQYAEAASELESLALRTGSAEHWSDLAAARLEAAVKANRPQDLVPALVAADRALSIQPTLAAALFNRASILQRMGVRPLASNALRVALVAEADPAWQQRIRDLRKEVGAKPDQEEWNDLRQQLEREAKANALRPLGNVADRFRQHARTWSEGQFPVSWASNMAHGDVAAAEASLRIARDLSAAVRELSGESLGAECVAVIDEARAAGDTNRLKLLIDGYILYGEGRKLYSDTGLAEAEKKLREAKRNFEAARTPMALVARLYMANTLLDQQHLAEARSEFAELEQEAAAAGKRRQALAADVAYQIAVVEGVTGHWGASLEAAERAVDGFRALDEKGNHGMAENILAELFDSVGQPERAWTHRVSAFDASSDFGDYYRLGVGLKAPSRALLRQRDLPAAISMLNLELEATRLNPRLDVADAMAHRALALAENGDPAAARAELSHARGEALTIKDDKARAFYLANIDAAEGVIERKRDPHRSTFLLDRAIDFFKSSNRRITLPALLLERGRSQFAAGNEPAALADFDEGIDELEKQRASVSTYDYRATVADVGENLFAEAIRIAVRRGDRQHAFEYSERAHAQALLLQIAGDPKRDAVTQPAPGTAVIEYMVLPEQLIVFALDSELRMDVVPIEQAELEKRVDAFTGAIVRGSAADARRTGSALGDILLRPVRAAINRADSVVFVPSRFLEKVPWAGLYEASKERYLGEDVIVSTAPSLAVLVKTARDNRKPTTALVTGNPRTSSSTFVDLPALPAAESEAAAIASLYPSSTLLLGAEATRQRFQREAAKAEVVHFAGHALSSESTAEKSFLVLARDTATGDGGYLYSRDIAQLPLQHVRLVVLAACGTMRGASVHLDGMPSIARSFLAAGVPVVIGTLWDIEDQRSARLFEQIHRYVANGVPPALAVQRVQIESIRSGDAEVAHPRTWSGLTVIGGVSGARTTASRD